MAEIITDKEFLEKIKSNYSKEEYALISYALDFSKEMHAGQKRMSGEPYYTHTLEAANILLDYSLDSSSICAALLHDIIEDTQFTEDEMRLKFGDEITNLIIGVTKLSKIKFKSKEEEQAENFRKLFFSIAEDIRVIFIKLADRLHNMRTLKALPIEKQIRIANETLDIYAPIASRIGLYKIKSELEDLCFKYLYPEDYSSLSQILENKKDFYLQMVDQISTRLDKELKQVGINSEIKGRPKHLYSVFIKTQKQNKTVSQISDLIALRVIVNDIRECYATLGIIHSIWKPVPGRFKDYIAMPKPNNYQSLHTTVISEYGQIFEVQIRTIEMHKIAEYGVAAHWKYKEGKSNKKTSKYDEKFSWIQEVLDSEIDIKDSSEFLDALKLNVAINEIYIFTPKGDVINLPSKATAIDFAYKIHSEIGNQCVGVKINGKMLPINTELETGDLVEVITNKNSKGPSRDWLKFVVTPQAKSKIKAFFKKTMKEENIKSGKETLEKEAKRRGYKLSELLSIEENLKYIINRYSLTSLEDLYASIGYGGLSPNQILLKLIDKYKKYQAIHNPEQLPQIISKQIQTKKTKSTSGILIEGFDDFLVRLSKCCNPVPGDNIIGYAARGTGISVHRADCPNVTAMEKERILDAKWAVEDGSVFTAKLKIEAIDKAGIVHSIIQLLANHNISIDNLEIHKQSFGKTAINLGVQIKSKDDLQFVIKKIGEIPNITKVSRST